MSRHEVWPKGVFSFKNQDVGLPEKKTKQAYAKGTKRRSSEVRWGHHKETREKQEFDFSQLTKGGKKACKRSSQKGGQKKVDRQTTGQCNSLPPWA